MPRPACRCCRSEAELKDIRAFKEAALEVRRLPDKGATTYDLRLARFYMWSQTPCTVFIACRVPTGGRVGCGWFEGGHGRDGGGDASIHGMYGPCPDAWHRLFCLPHGIKKPGVCGARRPESSVSQRERRPLPCLHDC